LGYTLDSISRTVKLPTSRKSEPFCAKRGANSNAFGPSSDTYNTQRESYRLLEAFFTPLYNALKGLPASIGLSRHGEVRHAALLDVANVVIHNVASRPTHVNELVQQDLLNYAGYCHASSAFGAGSVWFGASLALPPSVWRIQWPSNIK
jgi:hypothetical protein